MLFLNNKNISEYTKLNTEECLKELLKFNGVGPKVGDCIALFGMQKYDTFPVDVWVKRVMQEFYVEEDLSLPKIRAYAIDKFKELSGFGTQYLFYYQGELGYRKIIKGEFLECWRCFVFKLFNYILYRWCTNIYDYNT